MLEKLASGMESFQENNHLNHVIHTLIMPIDYSIITSRLHQPPILSLNIPLKLNTMETSIDLKVFRYYLMYHWLIYNHVK